MSNFRARAVREAQRYGADPWIFVRELLQNARDAGATQVRFLFQESEDTSKLICEDDGEGMAWEHAQTYLFSLYTSSKGSSTNKAGRFGVGFWSILRYLPEQIIIRSKPRGAHVSKGWGLLMDGQLKSAKTCAPQREGGTSVVLSKAASQGESQKLLRAVRDHGRFLTQRDHPKRPLEIFVNGVRINEPFALKGPSVHFERRGIRGVVGLGPKARVELFSRGLRVRSAATLDDLLSSRPAKAPVCLGLNVAPQILLDCDNIEVLLHRSDVREDAKLRRAIALARTHLRRLVEAQLSVVSRPTLRERTTRAWMWGQDLGRGSLALGLGCTLGLLLGVGWLAKDWSFPGVKEEGSAPARHLAPSALRKAYRGASVQSIEKASLSRLGLSYSPKDKSLFFRQFAVSNLEEGRPSGSLATTPYLGPRCEDDRCIKVQIRVHMPPKARRDGMFHLSLPEASGYQIDPSSLRFQSELPGPVPTLRISQNAAGEPWVLSNLALEGLVSYEMSNAAAPVDKEAAQTVNAASLQGMASSVPRDADEATLVTHLTREVANKVRYSTSAATAKAHQDAMAQDIPAIERALKIGAGDCDVQNTVLAALLRQHGYLARLAVGYVGRNGAIEGILHAWVEYRKHESEPWRITDASLIRPYDSSVDLLAQGPLAAQDPPYPERADEPEPLGGSAEIPGLAWVALGLVLTGLGIYFGQKRREQHTRFDACEDRLGDVVLGALTQPGSYAGVPGVFSRRIVNQINGQVVSLLKIQKARAQGRLWLASKHHAVAKRAIATGDCVLDARCSLAKGVAMQLGAVDLDPWQQRWESRVVQPDNLARLHSLFDELCISVRVIPCAQCSGEPMVLFFGPRPIAPSLPTSKSSEIPAECLVYYPQDHPLLDASDPLLGHYGLVKDLLDRIEIDANLRTEILGHVAASSLQERAA